MRLNDDDKRVLAAIFHEAEPVGVTEKQVVAAHKTLRTLGFIDLGGTLTQRGRHVAKSLPFEKARHGEFHGSQGKSMASRSGRADDLGNTRRTRRESGWVRERSTRPTPERSDEVGDGDSSDLPGTDFGESTIPD